MSHAPSLQNVATTSSARPSSRACVYAAMAAPTPATTSAYVVISEAEVGDGLVEGIHVDRFQRAHQPFVGKAGQVAVDRPLEVGDVALEPGGQAHVLGAACGQA